MYRAKEARVRTLSYRFHVSYIIMMLLLDTRPTGLKSENYYESVGTTSPRVPKSAAFVDRYGFKTILLQQVFYEQVADAFESTL